MNQSLVPLLWFLGAWGFCSLACAQDKSAPLRKQLPKTAISSQDINHKYVVIGPLGIPLGEVVTVEGIAFINPAKGDTNQFQVTSVNGRALAQPIAMPYRIWPWSDLKKLDAQARYRLRVYQDGGFSGVPEQAMKETTFVQTHAYYFVTSLVVVRNANSKVVPRKGK